MTRRLSILPLVALLFAIVACGSNDTTLKVTGMDKDSGDAEGGTYVRIYGNGFINPVRSAKVYFGSRPSAAPRFASDGEMVVEAPGGKVGETVDVVIIFEPGGEKKLPKAFTFKDKNNATPSVDDLNTNKDDKSKK
jgi:hypothetical protein